jgi:hypothetical protein
MSIKFLIMDTVFTVTRTQVPRRVLRLAEKNDYVSPTGSSYKLPNLRRADKAGSSETSATKIKGG